MNFGDLEGFGGAAANFLSTPQGQDAVKKYLASPEGMQLLQNFAMTPDGQKIIGGILPQLLGGANLPPGVLDMIKGALGTPQQ